MFNCSGSAEVKWWYLCLANGLNCHMAFIANSYTWMYMASVSNTFPQGNKMMSSVWCPKWVYSQRLPYLSNSPLFVSYLLFHETEACRKLSPQTLLFEVIQLVTCEITFHFLLVFSLPFFLTHVISWLFLGQNLDKNYSTSNNSSPRLQKEGKKRREQPSGCSALVDPTLEKLFFRQQQTAFVLHQQSWHEKRWDVFMGWVMWHYSDCLWGACLFK